MSDPPSPTSRRRHRLLTGNTVVKLDSDASREGSQQGGEDLRRRSLRSANSFSVLSSGSVGIISPRTRVSQKGFRSSWAEARAAKKSGSQLSENRKTERNSTPSITITVDERFGIELTAQLRWRNRNLLALTQAFLPGLVTNTLHTCAMSRSELQLPLIETRHGCVAKINCSGFVEIISMLDEHSSSAGVLMKCINKFYTHVIDIVMAYRGDVVRFNANTMVVFFEAAHDAEEFTNACGSINCMHTAQELACIRAAACCLELHKHRPKVGDLATGEQRLAIRVGVGAGPIKALVVLAGMSTETDTAHKYTVIGPSLEQAALAEKLADACETVFSPQAWLHVAQTAREGEALPQPDFHRFIGFNTRMHTYPMVRHAALQSHPPDDAFCITSLIRAGTVRRCLALLLNFLPDSVLRHAWAGTLINVNELRTLSIAFVNVKGVDPTNDGAHVVAGLVQELQKAAFAEEGYLHRFIVDENGLLLQFAFGMPPLVHTDDPLRACHACERMLRRAMHHFNLPAQAGIATGKVFCGLVGSDRRHEYGIVGETVLQSTLLVRAAEAGTVLVDSTTQRSCVELEFEGPTAVEGLGKDGAYMLRDSELWLTPRELASRPSTKGTEMKPTRVDTTPCTPPVSQPPPWLAAAVNTQTQPWEQCIPTLWTHVCAERPPPPPPPAQSMNKPWCTFIKVPIPWPARSTACGGVSPLPKLRCWRHLEQAELAVDRYIGDGGGLVALVGPFGCGKTELTEHLVNRAAQGSTKMQPIFGAMEARTGDRWEAVSGVLRGALALLQPSGRIRSARELSELLRQEETSEAEADALVLAGLVDPTPGALPRSRESLADIDEEKALEVCGALVSLALRLVQRLLVSGSLVISLRISQGSSLLPVDTTGFWMLAKALGTLSMESTGRQQTLLVVVTCRDMHMTEPSIERQHVVINIGPLTDDEIQRYIHLCLGLSEDWDVGTAPSLRETASAQDQPDSSELVASEGRYEDRGSEGRSSVNKGSDGGSCSSEPVGKVPDRLLYWLRRIADLPRHLEEGLTQLRRAGVIAISGGRCVVHADIQLLNTADWIHTHMVGRIISTMEVMVPEMQHVLQIAAMVPGGFSSLDLATATRVHLSWDTPNMLTLYHCVKHLIACRELVHAGFLRRLERSELEESDGHIPANSCIPRWVITSYLIQQVVSSTVLQGDKVPMKRTILLSRAMEKFRWERRVRIADGVQRIGTFSTTSEVVKAQSKSPASTNQTPRGGSSHPRTPATKQDHYQASSSRSALPDVTLNVAKFTHMGLPSSCIIIPANFHSEMPKYVTLDAEEESCGSPTVSMDIASKSANYTKLMSNITNEKHRSSWDRQKWRIFHKWLVFAVTVIVLLYPDLWIISEGSVAALDSVMLLAVIFFVGNIVYSLRYDVEYTCISVFKDLVLVVSIFLDVSWAMAKSQNDLAIQRRDPGSFLRVIGLYIKFGACSVRLALFIRSMAALLRRYAIKNRSRRQVHPETVITSSRNDAMLEDISKQLTQSILIYLVFFSILIVLSVQIVDLFTPPKEDASMQSWVRILSHGAAMTNSSALLTSSPLSEELRLFKQFYSDRPYGPFHICLGAVQGDFNCEQLLWQSPVGYNFADPKRESFTLDAHTERLQALFDFKGPAKWEAAIRIMVIITTVCCLVVVALSLDSVANRVVVAPLAKVLQTVRQVMREIKDKFPALVRKDTPTGENDEVAEFEEIVKKITMIVTKNKGGGNNEHTAGSEWINGIGTGSKSSFKRTPTERLEDVQDVPSPDTSILMELGVELEAVQSWSYDVLVHDFAQITGVAGWLLQEAANPSLSVQPTIVSAFLDAVSAEYRAENPYHNWRHACDVLHTVYQSCKVIKVSDFVSRVDYFALLVAAISHDAGHPGLNNIFLVTTGHELAMWYNDLSPLENMHCSTMFGILSKTKEANIFGTFSREQYRSARRVCIETILHTDNAKHFEMIKELQMLYHTNSDVFDLPKQGDQQQCSELLKHPGNQKLALQALLHAADISNPCKPWKICESWADLVLSEFFLQGDKEKEMGIPVQMLNNRETVNKPSSQVAFIEFFIYPFNTALVKIFPHLWEFSGNLFTNLQHWQAMRTPEEQDKTGQKVQTMTDELQKLVSESRKRLDIPVEPNSSASRMQVLASDASKKRFSRQPSVASVSDHRRLSEGPSSKVVTPPKLHFRRATTVGAINTKNSDEGLSSLELAKQKLKEQVEVKEATLPNMVASEQG